MLSMFAEPQDIREDGQQLVQVCSPFSQVEMGDGLVVVEDVEGEHVDEDLYFIDVGVLPGTGG